MLRSPGRVRLRPDRVLLFPLSNRSEVSDTQALANARATLAIGRTGAPPPTDQLRWRTTPPIGGLPLKTASHRGLKAQAAKAIITQVQYLAVFDDR
jgi:hypothetical protein